MSEANFLPQPAPLGSSDRACRLIQAARSAVETNELRKIPQNEICGALGISASTLINWTTNSVQPYQVEVLLRLLEQLPEQQWHGLLKRFLRVCPAIDSPPLAHEPETVSRLRALLRQRCGMTCIRGGSDAARTFVFTALGRCLSQTSGRTGTLSGIDTHVPDWFVPVQKLSYVALSRNNGGWLTEVRKLWPKATRGAWLMFNGLWSVMPGCQPELLALAEHHHVMVADASLPTPSQLRKMAGANIVIQFLDITEQSPGRLLVEFRTS